MTLPASGQISMSEINTELGLSSTAQISLNDTAARTLAGVASGQIDLNDFWGKSSYGASLTNTGATDFAISPSDAYAFIRVQADGTLDRGVGAPITWFADQTWKTGGGTGADYQCRWTNTSGTLSSGTAGSWLTLSSDQSFGVSVTTNGFAQKSCTGTLEIRMTASPYTVFDSCTVTLTAEVEI